MIADLIDETSKVGLEIHMGETKVLTSENQGGEEEMEEARHLEVRGNKIDILKKDGPTMYPGRLLSLQNPHDVELDNRIKKGWKKFLSLKHELCGRAYPLRDRLRLFNATVIQYRLYCTIAERGQ